MTAPIPPWALDPPPTGDPGAALPAHQLGAQAALTDPDAAGHQWVMLQLSDGTVTVMFRIAWQVAAQFGAGLANALAQVAQQAQAKAGPQLFIPPGGAIPDLFKRNGNGHGAPQ